jgi:hypothetical protein
MKVASPPSCSSLALVLALAAIGCDKPDAPSDRPASSSAPAAAPPVAPTTAPSAAPTPSVSATPAASAASSAPVKDAVASVFDPVKEPARTVKALAGGTVALYVPEWSGTSWKVTQPDAALGKPKEETIPGFAGPSTPAHAFTWQIKDALKGQTHKVTLTNTAKGAGAGPAKSFTLTIDVS